jgi:hypothetical protein
VTRGVAFRVPARLGVAVCAVIAGCADAPASDADAARDATEVRRIGASVELRRLERGVERDAIDVVVSDGVVLTATWRDRSITIEAAATAPGVPVTATVRVEAADLAPAELEIRNDLVTLDDATYRLGTWQERNLVAASIAAGPIAPALRALAPYREAIEARLAEAAPAFAVVGLFQAWPEGTEPAWPVVADPRDLAPPGHLAGDVLGVGMTCSTAVRCPNSAPYCVTVDHEARFGVCTRACASDAACGPQGRCSQPVIDIPDVTEPVLTCEIDCATTACPGLLACATATATCEATQDHAE